MTYPQFILLDEESQKDVFATLGVQVAEREEPGCIFQLYQVSGFYVEIKYDKSFQEVLSCTTFHSMTNLDPYLRQISIAELF